MFAFHLILALQRVMPAETTFIPENRSAEIKFDKFLINSDSKPHLHVCNIII